MNLRNQKILAPKANLHIFSPFCNYLQFDQIARVSIIVYIGRIFSSFLYALD